MIGHHIHLFSEKRDEVGSKVLKIGLGMYLVTLESIESDIVTPQRPKHIKKNMKNDEIKKKLSKEYKNLRLIMF